MVEITDVVCPLCGCVCDDIVVEVEDNEVKKVRGACAVRKTPSTDPGAHFPGESIRHISKIPVIQVDWEK